MDVSEMWSTQIKEIVIYRQIFHTEASINPGPPALTQIQGLVGVPGMKDYEVFLHQDKTKDVAQVTLLIGQNYEFALGPDISVAMTLVWDEVYGQFIPAVVPDNVQVSHYCLMFPLLDVNMLHSISAHWRRDGQAGGGER